MVDGKKVLSKISDGTERTKEQVIQHCNNLNIKKSGDFRKSGNIYIYICFFFSISPINYYICSYSLLDTFLKMHFQIA